MKLFYVVLLALPLLGHCYPATEAPKPVALDDVHVEDEADSVHAASDTEAQIQKRSGSFDYITHLKSGLLSSIGHASASIASGSSGGSSGSGQKSYGVEHHGNSVTYDPWSFKKAVLNTIFQAVKAITGGVTALKGQLIKGSGYALSASGNLVAASGDKVTDVGKAIINSAQIHAHGYDYGHSGGGGGATISVVHPFAKFSSLSGASSGGSKHSAPPPVVHTETITTYEIPPGHNNYGPPSKPPTYSSATHQYLPPQGGGAGYSSGGAPFSVGHAAFEAPPSNYLPTAYGHDGHDDFNLYGRHKKLTYNEEKKAVAQLQDILNMLPNGKTEYTASKTVQLDTLNAPTGPHHIRPDHVELQTYGLPQNLGPLESLSHTESITAAYAARPHQPTQENPSDIYRQMAKKQSPEEAYIQRHPNEGYDYRPTPLPDTAGGYKYNNYHATNTKSALNDLTPIIAALEVAKRRAPAQHGAHAQYTVEKSIHKVPPPGQFNQLPHAVQKSKYTYFDPAQNTGDDAGHPPVYNPSYKVRRNVPTAPHNRRLPLFKHLDYEITDPLTFNHILTL